MELNDIKLLAQQIRRDVIMMIYNAGSGHPGGALGAAEIFAVLYGKSMNLGIKNEKSNGKDRLVISNGHICAAWYSVLSRFNFIPLDELSTFRKLGTRLQGHPAKTSLPHLVESSSGPLGQAFPVAKGIAQSNRLSGNNGQVFCILGDGELQQGIVWETVMSASHHKVDNLIAIISYNDIQIDGKVKEIKNIQPLNEKFKAFNWNVFEVDGHNIDQLIKVFDAAKEEDSRPTAIIAKTVLGKGVSFMENKSEWHGGCPTTEQTKIALSEIGTSDYFQDFTLPRGFSNELQ